MRRLIAFCTTDIELVYANMLCRGVRDAAKHFDLNLVVLPGKALHIRYDFQYQYNVLYDYIDGSTVDGIVMSGGAVGNFLGVEGFCAWVERYRPIPMVSIAAPIPLGPHISADSEAPTAEMVRHLVEVHDLKNIAFVSGSMLNLDGQGRYAGYKRGLAEAGISLGEEYYFQGDFTNISVADAVHTFLDLRKLKLDAIVCANDEMAIAVLSQLRARGIRVPEDIAVTGFDDVLEANATEPPLTTIRQPVYQEGWKAVEMLAAIFKGETVRDIVLPGSLMLRESCGCAPNTHSDFADRQIAGSILRSDSHKRMETTSRIARAALERPGLRPERMQAFFSALVDARDRGMPPGDDAIRHLSNCVNPVTANAEDVRFLNHMLSSMRDVARELVEELDAFHDKRQAIEDFFDRARIVVGEKLLHIDTHRWDEHENDLRELRSLMYTMTSTLNDPRAIFRGLTQTLPRLGFNSAMLLLYENPIAHPRDTVWQKPQKLLPALQYRAGSVVDMESAKPLELKGLLGRAFAGDPGRNELVALPLFLNEEQLGIIIVDLDLSRRAVYESLCVQISAVLKLSSLIRSRVQVENKLRDAMHDLEAYNQHLSAISRTDEMTGLFNRRGFLHIARQSLHIARNMGKGGLLCFADMDRLKSVNDTYGHEQGDKAIKVMAEVLRSVFRSADLIGRLGGDEFVILVLDAAPGFETVLAQRIERELGNINIVSETAWRLSFTFGSVAFGAENDKTIETLLAEADVLLYARKRSRPVAGDYQL